LVAGDGGGGVDRFVEDVGRECLQLVGVVDDDRRSIAAGEIDAAGGGNGRGINLAAEVNSQRVMRLAGADIEAGELGVVALEEIEPVAGRRRRDIGRVLSAARGSSWCRWSPVA
jgi:hypothetical protein